jgi:hypothetical protein
MINVLVRWRWLRPAWEFISCLTEFKLYECTMTENAVPSSKDCGDFVHIARVDWAEVFGDDEASQPAYQVPHRCASIVRGFRRLPADEVPGNPIILLILCMRD